jgi:hypothetical protein
METEMMQDLADEALDIYEQGIDVLLRKSDVRKIFVVIVAANVVSLTAAAGVKVLVMHQLRKRGLAKVTYDFDKKE